MNTPYPCSHCANLYCDCMAEDNPDYTCECMAEDRRASWGNPDCSIFQVHPMLSDVDNSLLNLHDKNEALTPGLPEPWFKE